MNHTLKHRGPDDDGIYVDKNISLGNTRLAIIDLSEKGHQPMIDEDKRLIIVYNGEIYNFMELKNKLIAKGYKFRSDSDTEVILYLFKEYGKKAISMLNGMFAFAIWDSKERILILTRDRVGIKPLYYTTDTDKLIFSSEIKPLFIHQIKKEINKTALDLYMRLLYVPAPLTIYKGIYKVVPGQILIFQKNKLKKETYWKLPEITEEYTDKEAAREEILDIIEDSVNKQLVSDRPIGIFLSGGMDSSTLLAIASKINHKSIKTFSIGFTGIKEKQKFNADFKLAEISAKLFQSKHHKYFVSPQDALDNFIRLIAKLDEPISNPTLIPTYILAEKARKEVVVALGGDGGDEIFGGYDKYWQAYLFNQYSKLPELVRKFTNPFIHKMKGNNLTEKLISFKEMSNSEKYLVFMGQEEDEISKIYESDFQRTINTLNELRGFEEGPGPFHEKLMILDLFHWLPEESLMRTDKMTMQFGLEQRVPLLDNRLIDLSRRIPFEWKVGLQLRKKILRETFSDILPEEILTAPKRGFFSPGAKWLRNSNWKEYIYDHLSRKKIISVGYFKPKELNTMLNNHISGKKYNLHLIWAVLTFQAWHQENI